METYFAEIIYTFLYVILCKMFVESFAKRKSETLIWMMWIFILILTILDYLVSVFFADHFLVKQIIVILLGTTMMWRFYRLRFLKCSLIILFYQGLCFAADYFAWMALQKLIIITLIETRMLKFLMGTLSQLLVFGVIIVLRHYFVQEEKEKITDIEWIKFSLFPIFTILAIIAILINFNGLSNTKQINTLIGLAFGMLILNIFIFYLLWDAIEREVKIRKEQLSVERAKSQTEIYRQISENFDQQKKREHEYKNELMIISSLLKQNEIEKLKIMLNKYNDEIANRVDIIDTNHIIVNAILNTKYQEAREKGIVFVLKVNDLSQVKRIFAIRFATCS
ncbi:histidine kinase [Eubacterium sp. MSJ-13]|uniref:histidine kinase n=1 Tax=Eubacterium sp. MSJ-13 TaxID=2841513 RepID=UPI001C11AC73|nr:histidine kinase [Eubacterium sp. MSJ-13]MBU5478486.1 histidine kinase [Eubacterium sp. MSJ-13]